ncbi:MAG: RsmE family RNA methyltransferase [Victivallales bacterium]
MNLLLIQPDSLSPDRRFTVSGERAEHIRTVLRAKPGDPVKTGFLNGKTGSSILLEVEKGRAVLEAGEFSAPPPPPLPVSLIVSLPRPQSFKKVLHFAVSAGIKTIIFTHSARVEKSYWNSTALAPDAIRAEVIEGLEQGFDTVMPEIRFYRYLKEFFTEADSLFPAESLRVIAHPGRPAETLPRNGRHLVLAIGPEGGYVNSEIDAFASAGFIPAAFGSHILRVEFAAAFISGFLSGYRS